jgi:predicted metalloprotease
MRWEDLPRSDNIDDRRGDSGSFGGGGMPMGGGGLGIGTVVVLGIVGWALGIDPRLLIGGAEILMGGGGSGYQQPYQESRPNQQPRRTGAPTDDMGKFVAAVLGSADQQWKVIFEQAGQTYRAPRLVMFQGRTNANACGMAQSAMGPFYCPPTREIYLDTSFFTELEKRFRGCSGEACKFAQAYVIAHEVGHHVQNQLGILSKAQQAQRSTGNRTASNRIQVQVELQADCFAGVWAHHTDRKYRLLEPGDVEAALQTASAIGDDTLQRKSQGQVVPDSFTHGSAEQRRRWFSTGLKEGRVSSCNTFAQNVSL